MNHKKSALRILFALLPGVMLGVGCASADGSGEAWDGVESAAENETGAPIVSDETNLEPGSTVLARLDFADGNYVTFEELGGGVLVTEVGHMSNKPHLSGEQTTALAAFETLAPATPAPAALMQAHQRMYPAGATVVKELPAGDRATLPQEQAGEQYDHDLEHSGEFELSGGSLPASTFTSQLCQFSGSAPNYIHGDHTSGRTHSTSNVHTAYWAAATDIGILGHQACADGNCGNSSSIQAGWQQNSFYDAGQKCTTTRCEWWNFVCQALGTVTVCEPRKVRFDQKLTAISSQIRFHDCAKFTQ